MSEYELEGRCFERNLVTLADRSDTTSPVEDFLACCLVVIGHALSRTCSKNPTVKRSSGYNTDFPLKAKWQELRQSRLVQQRVAAHNQEAVEVTVLGELHLRFPWMHTYAD